jgi:hypothetical protein
LSFAILFSGRRSGGHVLRSNRLAMGFEDVEQQIERGKEYDSAKSAARP